MSRRRPHKLELYRHAVQHPHAEVAFLARAFRRSHRRDAWLLREDFAGTAAVAAAWCASHPQRQAMAIDHHDPTVRWAGRAHADVDDLHLLEADVLDVTAPRVDLIASLNFSTLIYHDRPALLRYFKHARRCLRRPGLFVMDLFGGPGAMRPSIQSRPARIETDQEEIPFTYHWEQKSFNPVTARIDCRIHFELSDGRRIDNAFCYDWRLWTPPELIEALHEAGFASAEFWCDRVGRDTGQADGRFRPLRRLPARDDWVAYLVATRDG